MKLLEFRDPSGGLVTMNVAMLQWVYPLNDDRTRLVFGANTVLDVEEAYHLVTTRLRDA